MSLIGKKPVDIPAGVKVELAKDTLKIAGAKESLVLKIVPEISIAVDESAKKIMVTRKSDDRFAKAMHGTTRAHIANMILGVTKGFSKAMQVFGTGYSVKIQGTDLLLTVGTAKPFSFPIPKSVNINIKTPNARGNDNPAEFVVSGPDRCVVGQFAAEVRKCRPPEPYKGKGIRYADEVVKRKEGKAFGSA